MSILQITNIARPFSGNGRRMGYPTANITSPADADEGVFFGYTELEGIEYPSIIFIGAPETFNETIKRAESHILDFPDRDLYGELISIRVEKKLRNNQKFDTEAALVTQMQKDEKEARAHFHLEGKGIK